MKIALVIILLVPYVLYIIIQYLKDNTDIMFHLYLKEGDDADVFVYGRRTPCKVITLTDDVCIIRIGFDLHSIHRSCIYPAQLYKYGKK